MNICEKWVVEQGLINKWLADKWGGIFEGIMKEINLHKLRCIIGAKAIPSAKILISTLSENGSAFDLHFPANEALQLNEYLGMAIKQIGWIVPEQVSHQTHQVPDQVYEIRKTGGINERKNK